MIYFAEMFSRAGARSAAQRAIAMASIVTPSNQSRHITNPIQTPTISVETKTAGRIVIVDPFEKRNRELPDPTPVSGFLGGLLQDLSKQKFHVFSAGEIRVQTKSINSKPRIGNAGHHQMRGVYCKASKKFTLQWGDKE